MRKIFLSVFSALALFGLLAYPSLAKDPKLEDLQGHNPIHVKRVSSMATPSGLSPQNLKTIYNIPSNGGSGKTIAIIDAYDDPFAQNDLMTFSNQFNIPCGNNCFEKHKMANLIQQNSGWALEIALDTQWAHAISPNAKILLVEAKSSRLTDLLSAVDYARRRVDVSSISMSWGSNEFGMQTSYDNYFTSLTGNPIAFFASSGDSGTGVSWPAVSTNVTGVGGTTLNFQNGNFTSETAWSGSGGGLSTVVSVP